MKAVFVIYNEALDSKILSALSELGVEQYTKFPKILGVGKNSEPHLNDLIWPGANTGLLILIEDLKVGKIFAQMKNLKAEHVKEGLKVLVMPVEQSL